MISVHCPICNQRMQGASTKEWPEFPFCSRRCKLVDLGRWLGEAYSVHQTPQENTEDLTPLDPSPNIT